MVESDGGGWSSEEEELNFGGTLGVKGAGAIRSATFVESEQKYNPVQKVSTLDICYFSMLNVREVLFIKHVARP